MTWSAMCIGGTMAGKSVPVKYGEVVMHVKVPEPMPIKPVLSKVLDCTPVPTERYHLSSYHLRGGSFTLWVHESLRTDADVFGALMEGYRVLYQMADDRAAARVSKP